MGRFPSEVVYSLPEFSNLDHDFWYKRRGVGATDYIPVGTAYLLHIHHGFPRPHMKYEEITLLHLQSDHTYTVFDKCSKVYINTFFTDRWSRVKR